MMIENKRIDINDFVYKLDVEKGEKGYHAFLYSVQNDEDYVKTFSDINKLSSFLEDWIKDIYMKENAESIFLKRMKRWDGVIDEI